MKYFCISAPELSEETFPTLLLITKLMKVTCRHTRGETNTWYIQWSLVSPGGYVRKITRYRGNPQSSQLYFYCSYILF